MALPELQDTSGRLTDCIYFGDPISASVGSGFVATTRTISTTAPLQGGGDLSANRTLSIDSFAGSTAGAVPTSLGGVVTFLRADGAWATPPTFGAAAAGYAPASGGGTTNFLRADGTWQPPAGTGISGLTAGRMTVANSATSITNARILEITGGHQIFSSEAGAAYKSLKITEDTVNAKVSLKPDWYSGISALDSDLSLKAVSGFAGTDAELLVGASRISLIGQMTLPQKTISVVNGDNGSIDPDAVGSPRSWIRLVGPTAPYSISGFLYGIDGIVLVVNNTTTQAWTVKNEDVAVVASTRILTQTGEDVVFPANLSTATFIYSSTDQRWILVASSPPMQHPRTLGYVPYQNSGGDLADSTLFHDGANNRYGFATATPAATLDVNGTFATRKYSQLLSSGLNSDIPAPSGGTMRVTGPVAAFSVGGIAVPAGTDGMRLTIHNVTSRAMTIVHEDASSTAAYRINTLSGRNVVLPARASTVSLFYDVTSSRWLLESSGALVGETATTEVFFNSGGEVVSDSGLTVSGTDTALSLTLGTDVIFSRKDVRQLELGIPNASPKTYVFTGNSSIGGTDSNRHGGSLTIGGGAGTGTGGGGDTILATAYKGTFGNTQNSFMERMVYAARQVTLTESSATTVCDVTIPALGGDGGILYYTIYAADATDTQTRRGNVPWAAVNKAGVLTITLGTPVENVAVSAGTLTVTVTAVDVGSASGTLRFALNAVSSLTQTSLYAWISLQHDGRAMVTTY